MSDEITTALTAEEEAQLRGEEPKAAPEPPAAPQPEPAAVEETAEQKAERLRDDKGRFASEKEVEGKVVPLATHLEERKSLQAKIRELEAGHARDRETMAQRLQRLEQLATQPPQQVPQRPSVDEQPVEVLRDVVQRVEQSERQRQAQDQDQQLVRAYALHARQFAQDNPDFVPAYEHFKSSIAQEVTEAMGYADPAAVEAEVQRFERTIATKALQDGVNPAERIYRAARARGYQKAAPQVAEALRPDPAALVDAAAKASAASKSLGAVGGNAVGGRPSLEAIASMSQEDFEQATAGSNWRKLMGG